jgi:hypothetical protein
MQSRNYTTAFSVDRPPEVVFHAINDVRGWWSEAIEGDTDRLGAQFKFRHQDLHRSTQKVARLIPRRKVLWHVVHSRINFVHDKSEWQGTDIVFEITRRGERTELRFTHVGLVPAIECYGDCADAWSFYINDSLHGLITTGTGKPLRKEQALPARGDTQALRY